MKHMNNKCDLCFDRVLMGAEVLNCSQLFVGVLTLSLLNFCSFTPQQEADTLGTDERDSLWIWHKKH